MSKIFRLNKHLAAFAIIAVLFQIAGFQSLAASNPKTASPDVGNSPVRAVIILRNDKTVLVNGQKITSGAAISSGARIETQNGAEAEIQMLPVGTLRIFPRTNLMIAFDSKSINATVQQGCASLFIAQSYEGTLTLPNGERKISPAGTAVAELNSCDKDDGKEIVVGRSLISGISLPVLIALIAGGGVATAAAVMIAGRGDDQPDAASSFRP